MNKNRSLGLGFLVFCVLIWTVVMPRQIEGPEEAILPKLAVIAIAVPALIMFIRPAAEAPGALFDLGAFLPITLPCLLLTVAYIFGINLIGFYLASEIFLVIALLLFGERRLPTLVLLPVAVLGAIYFVISFCLKFQLPQGLL